MRASHFFIFLLTISLIFNGCNNHPDKKPSRLSTTNTIVANNLDSFPVFVKLFKTDSIFQLSRIKFPLTKETLEENDGTGTPERVTTEINSNQWIYLSLKYDSTYSTRDIDAYTEKLILSIDTAHLLYLGVNNGINVEFIFSRTNNNWYLTRLIDLSD